MLSSLDPLVKALKKLQKVNEENGFLQIQYVILEHYTVGKYDEYVEWLELRLQYNFESCFTVQE